MCHFCKWSIYKGCLNNFDFNKFYLLDDICNIVIFRDQRIASHIQDSIISVITLFINVAFEVSTFVLALCLALVGCASVSCKRLIE
mgnify:CR=1 FL=1